MKKIILMLAMVSLAFGVVAQTNNEQIRMMVVQKTNGQQLRIPTEEIQDVTFEMVDVPTIPTTVEEAKAILAGSYWKMDVPVGEDNAEMFEGYYLVITEDLDCLLCLKVQDTATLENGEIHPFAGKYVLFRQLGEVSFPSEEDPTTFYGDEWTGTNLKIDSFEFTDDDDITYPCVRVEPFEYIGGDYLFKGKSALR